MLRPEAFMARYVGHIRRRHCWYRRRGSIYRATAADIAAFSIASTSSAPTATPLSSYTFPPRCLSRALTIVNQIVRDHSLLAQILSYSGTLYLCRKSVQILARVMSGSTRRMFRILQCWTGKNDRKFDSSSPSAIGEPLNANSVATKSN